MRSEAKIFYSSNSSAEAVDEFCILLSVDSFLSALNDEILGKKRSQRENRKEDLNLIEKKGTFLSCKKIF